MIKIHKNLPSKNKKTTKDILSDHKSLKFLEKSVDDRNADFSIKYIYNMKRKGKCLVTWSPCHYIYWRQALLVNVKKEKKKKEKNRYGWEAVQINNYILFFPLYLLN